MLSERLSAWFGTDHGDVVADVLSGKERIIKFKELKRYPCRTLSACNLAGLNFVRVAFKHLRRQRTRVGGVGGMVRWLSDVTQDHSLEEILSLCQQLNDEQSIQLDEMCRVPLFENALEHVATKYGPPSMILLKQSLRQMQLDPSPVSAMVVSRNASTAVCLKIRENAQNVFLLLDFALLAPNGHGATLALVISTSLEQTAARLFGILPVDNHMVTRDRRWQAQLFTSCTICMFIPAEGVVPSSDAESSAISQSIALLQVMGEIDVQRQDFESGRGTDRDRDRNRFQGAQRSGPSQIPERTRMVSLTRRPASRVISGSLQGRPRSRVNPQSTFMPYEQTKRHCQIFRADDSSSISSSPSSRQTSAQISPETSNENTYFECMICFEDVLEEEGVRILPCAHGFCRGCLAGHVCSKIEERKFPVFCPLCMTENGNASPSVVPRALAQRLKISEALWSELEMAHLYVRVDCRRCKHSAFLDKEGYEISEEVNCPFPGCGHTWCKICKQSISLHGPKHSCDGTEELDYLVRQMGWKYCPRCRIPVQKNGGCNHMTCVSSGCNTHFCYRCGKQITKTSIPFLIRSAVNAHFKQCTL